MNQISCQVEFPSVSPQLVSCLVYHSRGFSSAEALNANTVGSETPMVMN